MERSGNRIRCTGGRPSTKNNTFLRGAVGGLVVIVLATTAVMMLDDEDREENLPEAGPVHVPVAETTPIEQAQPKPDRAAILKAREEALFNKTNGYVKTPGKMLTPDGRELTFPVPKEGEYRIVHSHGRTFKCDSEGNFVDVTPKPVFDNSFEENLVGMATDGGAFVPGMLTGHRSEEIVAMLLKPVEILPDDPPDVVEKKEAVAALKSDMVDYIREGGTFDDYVMAMRKQTTRDRMLKSMATKEIVRMLREGKGAEAAAFRDAFNEKYTQDGMRPLRLPAHIDAILKEHKED